VWVFSWVGWDKNRRALSVFSFVRSGDRFLAKKNLPKINEVKEIHISFTSAVGGIYVADLPHQNDHCLKRAASAARVSAAARVYAPGLKTLAAGI
jgi:hypothetical protein